MSYNDDVLFGCVFNLLRHVERKTIVLKKEDVEKLAKIAVIAIGFNPIELGAYGLLVDLLLRLREDDSDLKSFGPGTLASGLCARWQKGFFWKCTDCQKPCDQSYPWDDGFGYFCQECEDKDQKKDTK